MAVDNKYEGHNIQKEIVGVFIPGEEVKLRVIKVKEDGKLDLSPKDKKYNRWISMRIYFK